MMLLPATVAAADGGDDNWNASVDDGVTDVDADDDDNSAYDHSTIKNFLGSQNKHKPHPKCLHKAPHLTDHPQRWAASLPSCYT